MSTSERLRQLRKDLGMSQEEFLKICKEMFQNMHPTSVEG